MTSVITSVVLSREYEYEVLGDNVLVPTITTVKCTGVASRTVQVHPLALPFGLLERVRVYSSSPFKCTIELAKTCGRTKTEVLNGDSAELLAVYADARDNQDAADPDLKLVRSLTGHVMQNRMIAAGSVVSILIAFVDCEIPPEFYVEYRGANVLGSLIEARSDGPRYAFKLPPLTPKARMDRGLEAMEAAAKK